MCKSSWGLSGTCAGHADSPFQTVILDDAHMINQQDNDLWNLFTRLKELPGIIVLAWLAAQTTD